MVDPASDHFLFDTSAEDWLRAYLTRHPVHVSAVTVVERVRGMRCCGAVHRKTGGN